MAPGELIDFAARRYPDAQTATKDAARLRSRAPVVVGLAVALPISALLWIVLIFGLRSLF